MATSKIPDVIDALVSICGSASSLSGVKVYDGPVTTQEDAKQILWIGMDDPDSPTAPIGGEFSQQFPGLGTRQRDDDGMIHCVAECWSGSSDVRSVRVEAFAIVAAVENLIRADATLGGTLSAVAGWAQVLSGQLRQNNTQEGAVARVAFQVQYKARI